MPDPTPPDRLYKYVGPDRVDILENGLVHFSKLSALNDPFEGRPYITAISDDPIRLASQCDEIVQAIADGKADSEIEKQYHQLVAEGHAPLVSLPEFVEGIRAQWISNPDQVEKLIRENADFQGARTDRRSFSDSVAEVFEHLGMLCLTCSSANHLMWSHYAHYHQGFSIGFDSSHPFFHQEPRPGRKIGGLIKVEYEPDRPRIVWDRAGLSPEEQEDYWITWFLQVKSEHWDYEEEYRIIRPLGSPLKDDDVSSEVKQTPGGALFELPPKAVVSVVLGMKISPDTEAQICKVLSAPRYDHVEIKRAQLHDEHYEIEIIDR